MVMRKGEVEGEKREGKDEEENGGSDEDEDEKVMERWEESINKGVRKMMFENDRKQ